MAGSVDLFLNISNGLDENLKKSEKSLSSMNNIADKVNKNMTNMNKSSNMLNDNYDDIVESSDKAAKSGDKLAGALDKARGFASKMVGSFGLLFGGFQLMDVVSDTLELNQAMSDLSYRMGEAGTSARDLENATTGVMAATGATAEVSQRWIIGLREMRVATKDLEELATVGQRFSVITGASEENTRNLIGSLNTMGGMGTKAIKGILTGMVAVQRAFGMAQGDMDRLTDSILVSSKALRNMGKSAAEVATFSKGVSKLAGAFASVGLSAETATKFVEGLLDPGAIEDNAHLYAKLGISMQDAMEGNIDPGKLVGGFKNLGAELKGMSNFAANELAKSLGMPLQELRAMSEMDEDAIAKAMGGAVEVSEDLKKEQEQQAELQRNFTEAIEKTKSIFMALALKVMPLLNKGMDFVIKAMDSIVPKAKAFIDNFSIKSFGPNLKKFGVMLGLGILGAIAAVFLFKKKFASVNTEIGKNLSSSLSSGMSEAMDMGAKKSATKFEERMKASTGSYMEDLQRRIIEGTDYAAKQSASNFYAAMGKTNLNKTVKGLVDNTAQWLDSISAGAKPVSLIDSYLSKSASKTAEKIRLEQENSKTIKGALETEKLISTNKKNENQKRIETLKLLKAQGTISNKQTKELERVRTAATKAQEKEEIIQDKIDALEKRRFARKNSLLKSVLPEERKLMLEAVQNEITFGDEQLKNIKSDKEKNQLSLDAMNSSKEDLILQKKNNELALASGKLKGQELADATARQQEIATQQRINNELISAEIEERQRLAGMEKVSLESMEKAKQDRIELVNASKDITSLQYEELEVKLKSLEADRSKADVSSEVYKSLSKDIERVKEQQMGALSDVDAHVINDTFGGKLKKAFTTAGGNLTSNIKEGFNKAGDSLRIAASAAMERIKPANVRAAIAAAGDGSFLKGLGVVFKTGASGIGSAIGKAGKGMGAAFSKIGGGLKTLGGPLLLLAGLFVALLKDTDAFKEIMAKVQEVFKKLMDKLIPVVEGLMQSLMPIIDKLMANLMPVIEYLADILIKDIMPIVFDLIDSLMPLIDVLLELIGPILGIIGELFKIFAPLFMDLVNLLMPPLLKILGTVAWIMGKLIGAIGGMVKALGELPGVSNKLITVGEGMQKVGLNFEKIGKTLADASENYGKSEVDLENKKLSIDPNKVDREILSEMGSVAANTDPESTTVTKELYPAIIEATSSGFVQTENARQVITGSPEQVKEELARETLEETKRGNDIAEETLLYNQATARSSKETAEATVRNNINGSLIPISGR